MACSLLSIARSELLLFLLNRLLPIFRMKDLPSSNVIRRLLLVLLLFEGIMGLWL